MLSLDENPLQAAGDFILGAPKPGSGAVNLYWGYNQGRQKDYFSVFNLDYKSQSLLGGTSAVATITGMNRGANKYSTVSDNFSG